MGEIKSAIELAMERTKNLVTDEEERRSLARQDIENKARVVLRRYLAGMAEEDVAVRELHGVVGYEDIKEPVQRGLLVGGIDMCEGSREKLVALFRFMDATSDRSMKERLKVLEDDFFREMNEKEALVRVRIHERLRELGITGDAVEPNIREWDEYREAVKEAERIFKDQISAWR